MSRRRTAPRPLGPRAVPVTLVTLVLAGCTGGPAEPAAEPAAPTVLERNAQVVAGVDGDTIVVEVDGVEETVRLIGIDTPETVDPDAPVECYGPEASHRTAELLPVGTELRLVRDQEARDAYGRLLAYVYRAADGLFVNEALVAEGFAEPFPFEPNTAHAEAFVAAARRAEAEGRGLWGACAG